MQKGTAAFTEYEFDDPDFIDFRMENPEVNMMKIGHMHSHNTMNTFFSGTDRDEVNENSEFHNYYLSIIVNNYLDFSSAIGFRSKMQTPSIIAYNEDGQEYFISREDVEIEETVVWVDCEVVKKVKVPQFIIDRATSIIAKHSKKTAVVVHGYQGYKGYPAVPQTQNSFETYRNQDFGKVHSFKNGDIINNLVDEDEDVEDQIATDLFHEALTLRVLSLNGKYPIKKNSTITSFLAFLGSNKIISRDKEKYYNELVLAFLESYKSVTEEENIDPDEYLDDIDAVAHRIGEKDTKGKSTFIQGITMALDNYYAACQLQFNNQNIE